MEANKRSIINHSFEAQVRQMTTEVKHQAVEGNNRDELGRKIWGFVPGDTCIYDSHGADSILNSRTGQKATVIRKLTEDEIDIEETGPMYAVQFEDGYETDVFEDELIEALPHDVS